MKTGPLVWIQSGDEWWLGHDEVTEISYKIEYVANDYSEDPSYYSIVESVRSLDSWLANSFTLPEAFEQVEIARRYERIRVLDAEIERLREGGDL